VFGASVIAAKHITNNSVKLNPSHVNRETNTASDLLVMQPAYNARGARSQILLPELRRGIDMAQRKMQTLF
jgi:hypothetical protein